MRERVAVTETADVREFRRLYEAHRRDLLAYFLRRVDPDAAPDCVDEVFLTVWRRMGDVPTDAARAWLFGVAHRVLLNQRRSVRRRWRLLGKLATEPANVADGPETAVLRGAVRSRVKGALLGLNEADQELLRLAYWEELPHADIGRILGCSTNAVDVRLHRAIRRLGKGLERAGHVTGGRPAVLPDQRGGSC